MKTEQKKAYPYPIVNRVRKSVNGACMKPGPCKKQDKNNCQEKGCLFYR